MINQVPCCAQNGFIPQTSRIVFIARQLNAIRCYFVKIDAEDDFQNQLYTSTDFPAFKTKSVHTFQLLGAAVLCGLYAGTFTFAVLRTSVFVASIAGWTLVVGILVTFGAASSAFWYLATKGAQNADRAVHE